MTRTVAIVQARMASTRLPGKVLQTLGDRTVLAHVLERCAVIPGLAAVVCAIPDDADCDPVAVEAARVGADVARGPEKDVLARYAIAARASDADVVLRVTSDCPLIDPGICRAILDLRDATSADYAVNNMPPSFPHGADAEAFPAERLYQAEREATTDDEREHVAGWLRDHRDLTQANLANAAGDQSAYRVTLDHPADLAMLRALWPHLPRMADMVQVVAALDAHPEIRNINRAHSIHG